MRPARPWETCFRARRRRSGFFPFFCLAALLISLGWFLVQSRCQKNLIDDADGVYGWLAEPQQPIQSVGTLIIAGPGAGTSIGRSLAHRLASGRDFSSFKTMKMVVSIIGDESKDHIEINDPSHHVWYGDVRNASFIDHISTRYPDLQGVVHLADDDSAFEGDCHSSKETECTGAQTVLAAETVQSLMDALDRYSAGGTVFRSRLPWFLHSSITTGTITASTTLSMSRGHLDIATAANLDPQVGSERYEQSFEERTYHSDRPTQYGLQNIARLIGARVAIAAQDNRIQPLRASILNLPRLYGQTDSDRLDGTILNLMKQAISHRTIQIQSPADEIDLLHVDDALDALIIVIGRLAHDRDNLSSGLWPQMAVAVAEYDIGKPKSTVSIWGLVGKITSLTESAAPIRTIPASAVALSRSSLPRTDIPILDPIPLSLLGFERKIGLDEGLFRLADSLYRRTLTYLEETSDGTCQRRFYTTSDIEQLAGCNISLYANYRDELRSPYFNIMKDAAGQPIKDEEILGEPKKPWHWDWKFFPSIFELGTTSIGSNGTITVSFRHISDPRDKRPDYQQELLSVPCTDALGEKKQCSEFYIEVEAHSGHLYLSAQPGEQYLQPPINNHSPFVTVFSKPDKPAFRVAPICCKQPAPWPFLDEDPLAAGINDMRHARKPSFAGSQHVTRCKRLEEAVDLVQIRIRNLASMPRPVISKARPVPIGVASDWINADKLACTNLCNHPTICLDTGSCACVASHCATPTPRRTRRRSSEVPRSLMEAVAAKSHLDVMRSDVRSYLSGKPDFPLVHVTELPEDVQADRKARPSVYDSLLPAHPACYSTDSMLERGIKLLNHPYSDDAMVFLPYFQGSLRPPSLTLAQWGENAVKKHLPSSFNESQWIIPFSHDWGICDHFAYDVFVIRERERPVDIVKRGIAWSVQGDINSPCYRFDQDVVIPPRTCLMPELYKRFQNVEQVRPARERRILSFFKGTEWGTGGAARAKTVCQRSAILSARPALVDAKSMALAYQTYTPAKDYLDALGDAVFCPLTLGIAGWAPRTVDTVYAGCIPVLFEEHTHHPFWDVLDWSKFSVTIKEYEIDRLEEILLSYTWEQVTEMQVNLLVAREALVFPNDEDYAEQVHQYGPLYHALHSTALLRMTRYPT